MFWLPLLDSLLLISQSESFSILRTETNTKLMQKNPEMDVAMISAKYHNGGFSVKKRTIGVIAVANAVKKAIIAV